MPLVIGLWRVKRANCPGACAQGTQHDGNYENYLKTAKWRINQPQSDRRQQDRAAGLNATIKAGSLAASLRRRAQGQQRIACGTQTRPTEPSQSVGEHRRFSKRNETKKHRARQQKQPGNEDTYLRPAISPATDERPEQHTGRREACDHEADFERSAAERGNVQWKSRLQERMLGRAEKLRAAQ